MRAMNVSHAVLNESKCPLQERRSTLPVPQPPGRHPWVVGSVGCRQVTPLWVTWCLPISPGGGGGTGALRHHVGCVGWSEHPGNRVGRARLAVVAC